MAILTLQIGQCGNQLGVPFFEQLAAEYASSSGSFYETFPENPFFRMPMHRAELPGRPVARSLLVDMEPSVVEAALRKPRRWTYSRRNCFVRQSGSGNNWATGYLHHGPLMRQAVIDGVRQEAEECDHFGGLLLLHSVAGGTGSGLGSFLSTCLADAFPKSFVLNYCVWPFRTGEVIVQSYNAVLSMAEIAEASHGIFLEENDELSKICQSALRLKRPSFDDMNAQAMRALSGALLPAKVRSVQGQGDTLGGSSGCWRRIVGDLLSVLCPRPYQKLLDCAFWPQLRPEATRYAKLEWEALQQQFVKKPRPGATTEAASRAFSHFLTLRGKNAASTSVTGLSDDRIYRHGVARLGVAFSPAPIGEFEKSASLISNAERNISPVKDAVVKAKRMLKSRAFLHSYAQHGLSNDQIQSAVAFVEDHLVDEYTDHS